MALNQVESDEVNPPSKPHLGLMTSRGIAPIPVNSILAVVEDPNHLEGTFFLVLREVSHRKLVFDALSADKSNTRRVTFEADWKGDFKSWWRSAQKVKQDGDVENLEEAAYDPNEYLK